MQDDQDDKYEPHEEGEYHFSDEDVTYEAETEPAKTQTVEQPQEPAAKLSTQRRVIISGIVFLALVYGIYRMLAPTATAPITDIPSNMAMKPPVQSHPIVAAAPEPTAPEPEPPVVAPPADTVTKAQMEEQLSAISNLMDQKINDVNTQTQALQTQVQQIDSRTSEIENKLNQLIQMLKQSETAPRVPTTPGNPYPAYNSDAVQQSQADAQVAEPVHLPYSVQAIIPGRAWLKSDSGDTITVAEGDAVRDLGKIVKIDPYDGVVVVNTGSRVVSLSYGTAS